MSLKLNPLGQLFEHEMQAQQSLLWQYALAQAALESRYFRSALVTRTNNAWGIKYVGQPTASPVSFMTTEYNAAGNMVKVEQLFCKWETVELAVRNYYRLVERRYKDSWAARTPEDFYRGMGRWATDPNYFKLCMSVYNKIFGV